MKLLSERIFLLFFACSITRICCASDFDSLVNTLLPVPQSVRVFPEKKGMMPETISGYCLKNKAELPPYQYYFPRILSKSFHQGIILLRLDHGIKQKEGYRLKIEDGKITIEARMQAGLQYGIQTLVQLVQNATERNCALPALEITDYPESDYRAVHLDMKNHMVPKSYLYEILHHLSEYKLNAIIVEYEDKLHYETHPEISLSNALTVDEWREWAEYAHCLNIDVSPLIQGIGHADFILKHDSYKDLRENSLSDWTCCPLNEDYYKVQFDLYQEAILATPYGKYLHVGGDEAPGLGRCPRCKATGKSPLQLQLDWLKKVSDYAEAHGRTPIFWDDMLFKGVGLYHTILDIEKAERQDSIWEARLPELNRYVDYLPKNAIYMRWKYEDAMGKGTQKVLNWYNEHGLKVMGATAAQTTFAMMPLENGNTENIHSFHLAAQHAVLEGILCTAWDEASPLFDTYWKGFIAHAQYGWNMSQKIDSAAFSQRYRIREFGNSIASLPDFRRKLETTFPLWETGLLDSGVRRGMWRTKGDFTILSLPTVELGAWSEKYADRLLVAKKNWDTYLSLSLLLKEYCNKALRNDYSLQVFSVINDLTGYTARLLLAISEYDKNRNEVSRLGLIRCINDFSDIKKRMEALYSETRSITQPNNYILPMGYASRLGLRTLDSEWMFLFESKLLGHLYKLLSLPAQ